MHLVDLLPRQRRRHLRAGTGAHRPGAEDGLVRRVLVEVDEDAPAALLLPPCGGDQLGAAALELACGRDRRGAHLVGVPARLEPHVDVEAAVPRRLRVAGMPSSSSRARTSAAAARTRRSRRPAGVEIEPQLVGDLGTVAGYGQTWKPRQARFTAQTTCAMSASTSAREVVPFGVLTTVVSSHSGADSGTRFWKNELPSAPFGKRCISVGRPPAARRSGSRPRGSSARGRACLAALREEHLAGLVTRRSDRRPRARPPRSPRLAEGVSRTGA